MRTLKGSGIIAMFTLRSRDRRPGPVLGDELNPLPSGSRHAECGPPQDPWPDLLGGAMQLSQACRRLHVGVGRARRCQRREIARCPAGPGQ